MKTKFRWFYVPEKLMIYPVKDVYYDKPHRYHLMIDGDGNLYPRDRLADSGAMGCDPDKDIIGPMWWTGLKDKNGKDIYHRDIVIGAPTFEDNIIGRVIFRGGAYEHEHSSFGWEGEDLIDLHDCKVVGNEIEHSHLLEANK